MWECLSRWRIQKGLLPEIFASHISQFSILNSQFSIQKKARCREVSWQRAGSKRVVEKITLAARQRREPEPRIGLPNWMDSSDPLPDARRGKATRPMGRDPHVRMRNNGSVRSTWRLRKSKIRRRKIQQRTNNIKRREARVKGVPENFYKFFSGRQATEGA